MARAVYVEVAGEPGRLVPEGEARVPVTDRGFVFGDGIYEVWRVYRGRPFRLAQHRRRLERSAEAIRLTLPKLDLERLGADLLAANGLAGADATVYVQATRGAPEGRTHAFPREPVAPTIVATARAYEPPPAAAYERGVAAITRPDVRWGRVDIKSLNLLPNVLAAQEAVDAGAYDTIFVRDGAMTESSRCNVLFVEGVRLHTHPVGPRILGGVTRDAVLELARREGIDVIEEPVAATRLAEATELLLTSTSAEILPVVRVDDRPIGAGEPGAVARLLRDALARLVEHETGSGATRSA